MAVVTNNIVLICLFVNVVWMADQPKPLDVVILIDSSDAHRSQRFEKEIHFLSDFVNQLYASHIQISLFTFGKNAHSAFTLDAYSNKQELSQAIQYVWFSTGSGSVSNALNTTLSTAFSEQVGGRDCTANFLILVTHSPIQDGVQASYFSNRLSKMHIRAIVLNMAGRTAEKDFVTFTNSSSRVVTVADFQDLDRSVSTVISKIETDLPNTGCGVLSDWGTWTSCSVLCGKGLNFRTRNCVKVAESDRDCEGVTTQNKLCYMPNCTDPIDGSWSMWQEWGACSKSCEKGSQQRVRWCNNPSPLNGGKQCIGKNTNSRSCADWKCPDCNKRCPQGSQLSQSCDLCECSSVTLFGKLMDNTNSTVENAEIFLQSRRYKPIAVTNNLGLFKASGICMMNEAVYVQAKGCEGKVFTTKEVNATHWTFDSLRLNKYVPPVFTIQPHDKIRMSGQNLTLCCKATGYPLPDSYQWIKDDIHLEGVGQNGTLVLQNLKLSDTGKYWCYTETDAGVSLSEKVDVSVFAKGVDTCSSPKSKLQSLPAGCYKTGDKYKNNTIDIGDCGKATCIKSSIHDNGTCSDWWPHHCCNPKDIEVVHITCDGFGYKTTKVKSCECKLCVFKTMIIGRAIGRQNGTDVPFKLGQVIMHGKPVARTNAAGLFKFDVPKQVKKVIVTFYDDYADKFETTTKIIQARPGQEVFASIVLPLKPAPILFDAYNGTEVHLGIGENKAPGASLEIPPNAIITADGEPFSGPVNTTISYMDPRNKDDLEAANGDFESEAPNGEKMPLLTFGMFQMDMKDKDGNSLRVNKPMKYSMDASMFNVPFDKDGNPDMNLWNYDRNKGIWVELADVKYEQPFNGGRKLLSAGRFVSEFKDQNIPEIEQTTTTTEQVPTGRMVNNYNGDRKIPEYIEITKRNVKEGSCYISVSIYKNLYLTEPYDKNDVEIKVFMKERDDKKESYTGATTVRLLNEGHACIPVFCNKYVELHVVNRNKLRLYAANHYLPNPYYVKRTIDNEVQFETTMYGRSLNCSALSYLKPNTICEGPMYKKLDEGFGKCDRVKYNDNSFQFKFAPFTSPPSLEQVAGKGNYDKKLSWYPVSPEKATFRTCFMKIRIDIRGTYDLRVIATSKLHNNTGEEFGSYIVGPIPDPRTDDTTSRCACVEFRCPGYVKDGKTERFNLNTLVDVRLTTTNQSMKCKIKRVNRRITVTEVLGKVKGYVAGFQFTAETGSNYGRNYGVYVNDNTRAVVQQICENGINAGPQADGVVDPKRSAAVEIDCLD